MSGTLDIRAGEKGVVRLFALNMPPEQARFLREPGAADQMLGATGLDPAQIDIFPVRDLDDTGLDGYLTEGCGIPDERIEPDRARLRGLDGWVMVLRSRAFGGRALSLTLDPAVELVGSWAETGIDWSATSMKTDSATSGTAPPRRPSPREARVKARRIGATVFTVVMLIVAAIVYAVAT